MSNVHQLVHELATYEQRRAQLENDLDDLEDQYDGDARIALENDTELSEAYIQSYEVQKAKLEDQLDKVYTVIDTLNVEIDDFTNGSYGYDDEDF